MSKLSAYIEAHTGFLNNFLPALKQIVDALPLPAPVTTAFNDVYATAPNLILMGGAALSELNHGAPQPAAVDLAQAFGGGPAPQPQPAPAPSIVTPPPAAPAVVATQAAPTSPQVPAAQPSTAPAPLVAGAPTATAPAPGPASVADPFQGGQIDAAQLAALAAKLGLTLSSAAGPIQPGT